MKNQITAKGVETCSFYTHVEQIIWNDTLFQFIKNEFDIPDFTLSICKMFPVTSYTKNHGYIKESDKYNTTILFKIFGLHCAASNKRLNFNSYQTYNYILDKINFDSSSIIYSGLKTRDDFFSELISNWEFLDWVSIYCSTDNNDIRYQSYKELYPTEAEPNLIFYNLFK